MKDLKFYIEDLMIIDKVKIWAVEEQADCNIIYGHDGDGLLVKQKVDPCVAKGEELKPLLDLPRPLFKDLVKFLINNRNKLDIVPEEESFTKGKLEATENHLNDLSVIVKKLLKM